MDLVHQEKTLQRDKLFTPESQTVMFAKTMGKLNVFDQ